MTSKLSWKKIDDKQWITSQEYPELIDYEGRVPGHSFCVMVQPFLPQYGSNPMGCFAASYVATRDGIPHGRAYHPDVVHTDPKHVRGWVERHKADEVRRAAYKSKQFKIKEPS